MDSGAYLKYVHQYASMDITIIRIRSFHDRIIFITEIFNNNGLILKGSLLPTTRVKKKYIRSGYLHKFKYKYSFLNRVPLFYNWYALSFDVSFNVRGQTQTCHVPDKNRITDRQWVIKMMFWKRKFDLQLSNKEISIVTIRIKCMCIILYTT